ncbi:hypothetical protein [Actinoallomurus iriomotensis]|uniref:Mce-associated membrane protein n=1 Tax=Actinoallomurus iriomotensis TaxID=478107 RepID=A0A9W6SA65_9ACTN|nr:hypothetical protein [Actinoallomurus iriomotensis]GLY88712.1 hypothetical protein Airi02_066410 [Actinoallomurus iriomotensis]
MARTTAEKRPTEPDEADEAAEPQPEETAAEEPTPEEAAAEEPTSEEAEPEHAALEETDGDATEVAGDDADGVAADEDSPKPRRRLPRISDPVLLVAAVLVVVAAVCAGYFGWSWYGAAHDDSLAYSRDRDAVLRAAEQGVQNMNTLDYRKVEQGLASWEASTTGDLHQQLVQGSAQFSQQVRAAKTVTTAKILDAAVTELDDRAGKAGAIVAVQITVTPPTGTPATKQSRMRAQLTRTSSGWKLSALGQAPVGTTAG